MHSLSRNNSHTDQVGDSGTVYIAIRDVQSHEESRILISPSEIPELVKTLMDAVHNYSMSSDYIEDDEA